MATVNKFVTIAQHNIGYKETGKNITKYAEAFDHEYWQFFNTKKQGCEWCSLFVHFCAVKTIGKEETLKFFGEKPVKSNAAAGVGFFWDYLKAKGYKSSVSKAKMGDIIFFKNSKGISHVGIVEKVDSKNIISIEGNKSNMVKRVTHAKTSSTIYGVMAPKWEIFDKEESAPVNDPVPDPVPEKPSNEYKVNTKSDPLMLRSGPGINYPIIVRMKKGSKVKYISSSGAWYKVQYKTMIGYAYASYLEKI